MATPALPRPPTIQEEPKTSEQSIDDRRDASRITGQVKVEDVDQGKLDTRVEPSENRGSDELEELLHKIRDLSVKEEDETSTLEEEPDSKVLGPQENTEATSDPRCPSKGQDQTQAPRPKGFTLEPHHANMLLRNPVYFVVFPNVYMFDIHRIVCRVDNQDRHHEVDDVKPNPPGAGNVFSIDNISYWFDRNNQLSYNLDGQWYMEATYVDLSSARREIVRYAEQNRLPLPAPAAEPSTSRTNTHRASRQDTFRVSNLAGEEDMYPPFPQYPAQAEVDAWFQQFKARREVLQKQAGRALDIKCPIENCWKSQRRPQALRDHLYFHFGIKPYSCENFGCPIAFETEANMKRHMDTCMYNRRVRG
ncbi:hypothetical protein FRC12_006900 [Ceratobasidium sp. 428]|nr:hypothetical protein FRC12_006900 [Ceratobasidium sp. 428]